MTIRLPAIASAIEPTFSTLGLLQEGFGATAKSPGGTSMIRSASSRADEVGPSPDTEFLEPADPELLGAVPDAEDCDVLRILPDTKASDRRCAVEGTEIRLLSSKKWRLLNLV